MFFSCLWNNFFPLHVVVVAIFGCNFLTNENALCHFNVYTSIQIKIVGCDALLCALMLCLIDTWNAIFPLLRVAEQKIGRANQIACCHVITINIYEFSTFFFRRCCVSRPPFDSPSHLSIPPPLDLFITTSSPPLKSIYFMILHRSTSQSSLVHPSQRRETKAKVHNFVCVCVA